MKMRCRFFYQQKSILFSIGMFYLACLTSTAQANPPWCADIFQEGLQSHTSGGYIKFNYNTRLLDSPKPALKAQSVITSPWSINKSCGDQDCTAAGGHGPRLYGPVAKTTDASLVALVPPHTKYTIGATANKFRSVTIQEWATGEFSGNHHEYVIDTLEMSYKSRLRLPAGNYWIKTLKLEVEGKIDVLGEGSVNLFVIDALTLPLDFRINESSMDPAKFAIYTYSDMTFYVGSRTYAFAHIENQAKVHHKAAVVGGIIARDIELLSESHVRYEPQAVQALDFGSLCRSL